MAPQFSRICQLLAAAALLQGQTPPLSDEVLLLSRIRRAALDSLKTIPSYTCLETIERVTRVSPKQRYRPSDTVQLEVAEFGKRELFAWPGQTNFEEKDGQILGLSSYGEFYAHLNAVMAGSAAIHYAGTEDCEGRPCVRYDFTLGQAFANWAMTTSSGNGLVAERGSFWADPQSSELYRLMVEAEEIPLGLGIRSAELDIRYGVTRLQERSSTESFQLPQSYSLHMILISGEESQNTASFTHCRAYQSESKLVAEASPESIQAARVQEITLPAHLTVELNLTTSVRSGSNRVGDRIDAIVDRDVKKKGEVVIPRGAQMVGRVRRLEHYLTPNEYLIAALEFTDISFTQDGVAEHARFTGDLQFHDPLPGLEQENASQDTRHVKLLGATLPGVGTFVAQGPFLSLPKGFHMTWLTTSLEK
jgi:hypothetical protein